MSALVNFIKYRMEKLKKIPSQVADDGGLSRSALSYVLKEKKSGKPVRPEPDTIKKIAKGLEVHPSILVSAMGYPTDPIPGVDERLYEIASRLLAAPWLADRIDDLLAVPRDEFDDLMDILDQKERRRRQRNGTQSTP
jgi:transcriptional regulator with XRE-family HTH domain